MRPIGREHGWKGPAALAMSMFLVGCGADAGGDDSSDPLSSALGGNALEFVVPYSAGGAFDQYARLFAPCLEDTLGRDVVVRNKEGAGGLLGLTQLANTPPDQPSILLSNVGAVSLAAVRDPDSVTFDVADLAYIGQVAVAPYAWFAGGSTGIETVNEALSHGDTLPFASAGTGSADFYTPYVLGEILGFEPEVVSGFPGAGEARLAVVQGEVPFQATAVTPSVPLIEAGDLVPILSLSDDAPEGIPDDVPTVADLELEGSDAELWNTHQNVLDLSRIVVAQPGLDSDIADQLREALADCAQSDSFLEKADAQNLPIQYAPSEDLVEDVETIATPPEEYAGIIAEAGR